MSATVAQLAEVNATVAALKTKLLALDPNGQLVNELNAWFYAYCGCLVFFMQAGFALLEAGSVRAKNAKNILMKNLLDACIGALIWWGWGYGVAVCQSKSSADPPCPIPGYVCAASAQPLRAPVPTRSCTRLSEAF